MRVAAVSPYPTAAARRLARYRKAADDWNARVKPATPRTWRDEARSALSLHVGGSWQDPAELSRFESSQSRRYYVDNWPAGWRDQGTAEEVSRREGSRYIDHSGWFCDAHGEETVIGHVLQIPARDGKPQYVPGISWSDQEGVTIWPLDRHAEPLEAARAADQYAKYAAEEQREWAEANNARLEFDEAADSLAVLRRDRRALRQELAAMHGQRGPGFTVARKHIAEMLAASRRDSDKLQARREELAECFDHTDGWKAGT